MIFDEEHLTSIRALVDLYRMHMTHRGPVAVSAASHEQAEQVFEAAKVLITTNANDEPGAIAKRWRKVDDGSR